MTNNKMKKGFTLIEIVIVLAIAALIMVVVFLAVQGAQRAQRDNFRKDIVNQTAAAIQSYKGNNNGAAPTGATQLTSYVRNLSGNGLTLTMTDTVPATCTAGTANNQIYLTNGGLTANTCLEAGLYSRASE